MDTPDRDRAPDRNRDEEPDAASPESLVPGAPLAPAPPPEPRERARRDEDDEGAEGAPAGPWAASERD
ncbi:hypothetical protein ACFZAU_21235 [Streptomyces sp. NPDC008238]